MSELVWIKDVIYLLPVAGLIWKAAMMSSKIKQNEKEIEEIKGDVKDQNKNILEALDRINTTMLSIKCDVEILKAYRKTECTTSTESQTK